MGKGWQTKERKKKQEPLPAGYVLETTSPEVDQLKDKYAQLGLSNIDRFITGTGGGRSFNETKAQEATIREVYKLDPAAYVSNNLLDFNAATAKYRFEQPKLTKSEATSFIGAVNAFQSAVNAVRNIGVENMNKADRDTLAALARQVRDYDSKDLGANAKLAITNTIDAENAINSVYNQIETVRVQDLRRQNKDAKGNALNLSEKELEAARGRYETEVDSLRRITSQTNQAVPGLSESLGRIGLADIAPTVGRTVEGVGKLDTGLEALRGDRIFQTGALAGRLNFQVTDNQILSDINTARRNEFKSLYDIGTAAVTDLQNQLSTARKFFSELPSGDRRRADAQKTIDSINKELTEAQKDTLEARNLYENYAPVSGTQATQAISRFRESLRLPEQRTLDQIREIDPNLFNTITQLSKQYGELAAKPIGPTTAESTEALRRQTEGQIAAQVALGSRLGAEEQRQYQQAARAAQTARGNIFGVAPAVEEAVTTGLAGEQRLAARLGAAQGFLSSGQSVSDALARDVSLRNALEQSRLGAAAEFAAAGPSPYNLATQRFAQQQGLLQGYLAASRPQATGGFQATPSAMVPYAYVDPMAGTRGAQTAANIYGSLSDYQARTYGAQVNAISQGYRSFGQEFASIAGGLGNFTGLFGAPGSSAFFRA